MNLIPISQPYLDNKDREYVNAAVTSGWISSLGKYIDAFESEFASFCGAKYAVAVSNGTVGLHLSLMAAGIGPDDEVIIPDLTFVATANAVMMAQARPVIVDVLRTSYGIDPESILAAITPKTKAIIPVHLYGNPADMHSIMDIARKNNLIVIEDAAEAHGALYRGRPVGAIGNCGVFSFYGNKIITSGEGGMIVTNDKKIYDKAKHLRDHAMSKEIRYWHTEIGYNYRMTNLQAALGLAQLEKIGFLIDERKKILDTYKTHLNKFSIICNGVTPADCMPVNWLVSPVIEELNRVSRDQVIVQLKEAGVDSRPFFYPLSTLPMYSSQTSENLNAKFLSERGINLPTFVGIKSSEIEYICKVLVSSLESVGVR